MRDDEMSEVTLKTTNAKNSPTITVSVVMVKRLLGQLTLAQVQDLLGRILVRSDSDPGLVDRLRKEFQGHEIDGLAA